MTSQTTMEALSKKDIHFADLIQEAGFKRHSARTIVFLLNNENVMSDDIQLGCNLAQPEVSIAIKELKKLGWITESQFNDAGRGRPKFIYSTNISNEDVLKVCKRYMKEQIKELNTVIDSLKEYE